MADLKVKITVDGKEEYISVEKLAAALRNVGKAGGESAGGIGKGRREVDQYKKALKDLQEPMEKVEKTFKMLGKASGIFLAVNAVSQLKQGIDSVVESQKKYNNAAQGAVMRYDQATSSIAKAIMQSKTWQRIMEAIANAATKIEGTLGGSSSGLLKSSQNRLLDLKAELAIIEKINTSGQGTKAALTGVATIDGKNISLSSLRSRLDILSDIKDTEAEILRIQNQQKKENQSDLEFLKSATKNVSNIAEAEIRLARVAEIKKQANFGTEIAKQAAIAEKALQELISPTAKAAQSVEKLSMMSPKLGEDITSAIKRQREQSLAAQETTFNLYSKFQPEFGVVTPDQMLEILKERKKVNDDDLKAQQEIYNMRQELAQIERDRIDSMVSSASQFTRILGDALTGQAKNFRQRILQAARDFAAELISSMALSGISKLFGGGGSFGLSGILFGGFRANGGDVQAGKSYIVGERGAEMFTPKTNGYISPNKISSTGFDPIASSVPSKQSQQIEVMNNLQLFIDSQQVDASIKRNGSRLNTRRGLTGATA